ncbi:13917_t:CDS:2, partial [Funneliformis mosseae]
QPVQSVPLAPSAQLAQSVPVVSSVPLVPSAQPAQSVLAVPVVTSTDFHHRVIDPILLDITNEITTPATITGHEILRRTA